MSEETQLPEGIGDLLHASIAMHVLFQTYMQAGFTEDQAIKLVVQMATATAKSQGE